MTTRPRRGWRHGGLTAAVGAVAAVVLAMGVESVAGCKADEGRPAGVVAGQAGEAAAVAAEQRLADSERLRDLERRVATLEGAVGGVRPPVGAAAPVAAGGPAAADPAADPGAADDAGVGAASTEAATAAPTGLPAATPTTMVVVIEPGGKLRLDGKRVAMAGLEAAFRAAASRDPGSQLVIQAGKGVAHAEVAEIMELAKQAGLGQLAIGTSAGK